MNSETKAILVKLENGINTYEVYNENLRKILFFDKEKRDALTNLPGLKELGIPSNNEPIRVVLDEKYAIEYLKTHFNVTL